MYVIIFNAVNFDPWIIKSQAKMKNHERLYSAWEQNRIVLYSDYLYRFKPDQYIWELFQSNLDVICPGRS